MTDTLLQVLSNADLDWMRAHGEHQSLSAGQILLRPHTVPDRVAVVVDGALGASLTSRASSPDQSLLSEELVIDELGQGALVGVAPLLGASHLTAVQALKPTVVVSWSLGQLQAKLADDVAFAAHLYRAIALQLCDRLRRIFAHPGRIRGWDRSPGSDVLTVFGELRDSDIDWLTSFGQIETLPGDRVLLPAARPVESLYILLEGQMAMAAPQDTFNPFALCFWGLEASAQPTLATLGQGALLGVMAFLDCRPLPVTVRSLGDCLLFAVPRSVLTTKLQVDDSFASRFYRVSAMQVLEQLQTVSLRLGASGPIAPEDNEEDNEMDLADLTQAAEGAKKFGWMLAQLGVNHRG